MFGELVMIWFSVKGIFFGMLFVDLVWDLNIGVCLVDFDCFVVEGVDEDLVVKMFGWKGIYVILCFFICYVVYNEFGMQVDELVGSYDGDYDGVIGEFIVGDLIVLLIYMVVLECFILKLEFVEYGFMFLVGDEKV